MYLYLVLKRLLVLQNKARRAACGVQVASTAVLLLLFLYH